MATLSENNEEGNENVSFATSLSLVGSQGSGSLSSGLSIVGLGGSNNNDNNSRSKGTPDAEMRGNTLPKVLHHGPSIDPDDQIDGASSLISLFTSPPQQQEGQEVQEVKVNYDSKDTVAEQECFFEPITERRNTERMSNSVVGSRVGSKNDLIDKEYEGDYETEATYLLGEMGNKMNGMNGKNDNSIGLPMDEFGEKEFHNDDEEPKSSRGGFSIITWDSIKAAISGSVMFILFHILFCLAQASAIHRPHSSKSMLGPMTRMSALGPIVAGPMYIYILGDQFPALYPTIDAFPAPFLVQQAVIVDDMLFSVGREDEDDVFMTTFCALSGLGLIFTALFVFIGTKFKLANLGAYLPYPVLAGFFSTVGFLGWTLAFSVDTGKNIGEVITDRDLNEAKRCLIHHIPSVVVGVSISVFVSGPRKSWTPLFVLGTIPIVFAILYFTGTSLEEARELGWFWKREEFESVADDSIYNIHGENGITWNPPLPFGVLVGILRGKVYFPAIIRGLPVSIAMGLMYLLRVSLHVPALKKNSETLLKWVEDQESNKRATQMSSDVVGVLDYSERRVRTFSEESCYNHDVDETEGGAIVNNDKKVYSVSEAYLWYAKCLTLSGLAGGSATIPSMGASITLFKIGARGKAPQYGSVLLLVLFYLNKFELVGYIPRIVFSTLLFVSSMDLLQNWFILSYQKTADKGEWLIVPILSLFAFVVGVLPAVALGLALSTFIFVATFYRSGVVKFIATGTTVHSTTERNIDDAEWLDANGNLIQVMVLQNYLFFGNANSVNNYVATMFETRDKSHHMTPPFPKYLIIDMSLVTGMDTSAVEIFSDIVSLCHGNKCQVFLAGLSSHITYVMKRGGVKPSLDKMSKYSILRLPPTMESALMKAEDGLLKFVLKAEEREMQHVRERRMSVENDDGFLHALTLIDFKHGINIATKLVELRPYTTVVGLAAGESLFHNLDGSDNNQRQRGLFFIEHGILRIERDAFATNTRTANTLKSINSNDAKRELSGYGSLTNLHAAALSKLTEQQNTRNVRIARFGSGWVVGALEGVSQMHSSGIHIAVTPCRLHLLPYEVISRLENEDPGLVLQLFKMMSLITARRQEATIAQLATLQTIMSTPPTLHHVNTER